MVPQNRPVWIHTHCGGLHHYWQRPQSQETILRGPRGAAGPLSSHIAQNGQSITRWAMPDHEIVETVNFRPYPKVIPMAETEPLLFKTWELLMSKMPDVMKSDVDPWDPEAIEKQKQAKYEARGIAETLAILMKPFMDPPEGSKRSAADMVVSWAVKYYKDNTVKVPGLGLHLWDPFKNADGTDRVKIADPDARKPAVKAAPKAGPKVDNKSTKKLTSEEAEGIKEAVSSGMFSEAEVASMFKVSLETVRQAVSS